MLTEGEMNVKVNLLKGMLDVGEVLHCWERNLIAVGVLGQGKEIQWDGEW